MILNEQEKQLTVMRRIMAALWYQVAVTGIAKGELMMTAQGVTAPR